VLVFTSDQVGVTELEEQEEDAPIDVPVEDQGGPTEGEPDAGIVTVPTTVPAP
jgi:hypothetical protein